VAAQLVGYWVLFSSIVIIIIIIIIIILSRTTRFIKSSPISRA
jgi:hypothetical protein